MNRKYNDQQIIELHSKGLTDKEIAEIIGVSANNMANKRKSLGLVPNKSIRETYKLTNYELSLVIGTLLGDGTIRYVHKDCKYPNLTFSHCTAQKEYFDWLTKQLVNLKSSDSEYKSNYVRVTGEPTKRLVYTGKNMKYLVELRDVFYKDNHKVIPIDYIKKYFNEYSLYAWFMDNGSYDKKGNSFIINTQCFTIKELRELVTFLKEKYNLYFNIKSDKCLYLTHKSNKTFVDIINKINECDSMRYKFIKGCPKTPLNRETPEMDNPVLNPQEIEENAERLEVMSNK